MRSLFVPLLALAALSNPALAASSLKDTWATVQEGAYEGALPQHRTTFSSFFTGGVDALAARAQSTLADDADILDPFQKLVHPIGICFSGTWAITEASPYTGYFAQGKQGRIIVRASEALGQPDRGGWRSFGFAGKIYPTTDPADAAVRPTANFFTIDDLGGAKAAHFLDDLKSNEPKQSFHAGLIGLLPTIAHLGKVFHAADDNPGIRQMYEVAELGLADPAQAVTPHWFRVVTETAERHDAADFRDELRLRNYRDGLVFGIYVAEDDGRGWARIGSIRLDGEALSSGCDHRLHFHHPKFK